MDKQFDPVEIGRAAQAELDERWEAMGASVQDRFHAAAQLFGASMTEFLSPEMALQFLKQEADRVQLLCAKKGTIQ